MKAERNQTKDDKKKRSRWGAEGVQSEQTQRGFKTFSRGRERD